MISAFTWWVGMMNELDVAMATVRANIAGLVPIRDALDKLFSNMIGSAETWTKKKSELKEQGRWAELLY